MKTKGRALSFACLAIFALLTGCGGGGGSSSSGGGDTGGSGGGGSQTPTPTVSSISPTSINAGASATTLTVNGTGFIASTTIQVGGTVEATTYVSSTQVTAIIPAAQLASGSQLSVVAVNGALSSSPAGTNLQVMNPAPTITSISPTAALAGTTSPTLTVIGTGFVPTTTVQVNGNSRTTTYVNATQVNAVLTSTDVAAGGALSVTAVNGTPGGGTSTATTFTVSNPIPVISTLSPSYFVAGASPSTITVNGGNFTTASSVLVGGTAVPTTFVSANQLTFALANQTTAQSLAVAVSNPTPGGGTSTTRSLTVLAQTPAPVITQVSPNQFVAGSSSTSLTVNGSNLGQQVGSTYFTTGTVLWNGTPLTTSFSPGTPQSLYAQVPANLIASVGTANISVSSITSTPSTSNTIAVNIIPPPPPTLTYISPYSAPVNTAVNITLTGSGFTAASTVAVNGTVISSKYSTSTQLTATIPAAIIALPGNYNLTVTTPAPGGGTTAAIPFTAYIGLTNNDIVFNPSDGMLYASIPGTVNSIGNSVIGIDPVTGNVARQIWVGSNPNKLALSTDGTQLFVGLDGSGAVEQVDLTTWQLVNKFWLGGGNGVYNPPFTALYMAGVPGSPNSVAVAVGGSPGVTIYDSGIARAKTSSTAGYGSGPIAFGTSSSTLYLIATGLDKLTVDSTGIASGSVLNSTVTQYGSATGLQYDNGKLYVSNGGIYDATTGTLAGTFYATTNNPIAGPVVSDSTLGLAFAGQSSYSGSGTSIIAFNESTLNPTGTIPFNGGAAGSTISIKKIVRWGQNGLALNTPTQIFIFQSPLVKDLSPSPADLSVSMSAPATTTTGTAIWYSVTLKNLGPNTAQGATLSIALDSSLIINSITASQGSCSTGNTPNCDLGNLSNGSSATVTVNATPTTASTLTANVVVNSVSYDPTMTNNQASTSTTVTGSLFAVSPTLTTISPSLVLAGSGTFTLTVTGSGFNAASTVSINGTAQTTTYVSPTQLAVSVDATLIKNFGWAPVTVSNASPGGGTSQVVPLTIYATANVPANAMLVDPFTRKIYATVPSASTSVTGNSIVAIDPSAASVGTPVLVGSEPHAITETSDGNYIFASLTGANSLAKFDLLQQSLVATIPVNLVQNGNTTAISAGTLAAMPGTDNTLAVGLSTAFNNFGIFDISGNTGTFRPNLSGYYAGVNPVFADSTNLYAFDSQTSGAEFYRYSVNANGLTLIDGTTLNGMGGYGGGIQLAGGLVYGFGGGIANPSTTPPSQVAVLPQIDPTGTGNYTYINYGTVPDASLQKDFTIAQGPYLVRYDGNRYLAEWWWALPIPQYSSTSYASMLRWGQDGLAILQSSQVSGKTTTNIMLLRGPVVSPQELTPNQAATLSSSSITTISHGAGNTMITLTVSNIVPGVAANWNGDYRTTTIVDATHLSVAIPASDLANAGTASLTVVNPGAAASNALTVTIN